MTFTMTRRSTAPLVAASFTALATAAFIAAAQWPPHGLGVWDVLVGTARTATVLLLAAWTACRLWDVPLRIEKIPNGGRALIAVVWLASASLSLDAITTLLGWNAPAMDHVIALLRTAPLPAFFVASAAIALLPAFSEEALFRGAIARYVERESGIVASFITTSVLFGAIHLSLKQGVQAALLGLLLQVIARREGLSVAILAHAANNLGFACLARAAVNPAPSQTLTVGGLLFAGATFAFVVERRAP